MDEVFEQILFYVNALWRRRWFALITCTIVSIAGWTFVSMMPDQYKASSRIYVDTANILRPLLSGLAVEADLDREVEVMRRTLLSRPNLEEVARMTDLDVSATTETEMDALIEGIRDRTNVESDRSNLFLVSFEDHDPVLAKNVVQALTTIFVENNLGEKRNDMNSAQRFLEDQIRDYETQLEAAEERMARFKQRNLGLLPGATGYEGRRAQAQDAVKVTREALDGALTRLEILQRELEALPTETVVNEEFGAGPPSDVDIQIAAVEAQIRELLSLFTDKHPDVKAAQRRLEALQEKRALQEQQFVESFAETEAIATQVSVPNPLYDSLKLETIRQESDVEFLRKRLEQAELELEAILEGAMRVPEVEAEMTRLNRDYEIILSKYQTLLSRRETARISADRETSGDRLTFRIIEPPKVPTQATGPNRPIFYSGVFVGGLGAGIGIACLIAMLKTTYGSITHLRRDFDAPVIGSFSMIGDRPSVVSRGVSTVGFFVAGLVLLAIYAGFMTLGGESGLGSSEFTEPLRSGVDQIRNLLNL